MTEEEKPYDRRQVILLQKPVRPLPTLKVVYHYDLINCPGKCIVAVRIEFPPNGSVPPHRHGGASVIGHVLDGTTLNKMNDDPAKVIEKGGSWYEAPGCHHKIGDNHSKTEPLTLFATFIMDREVYDSKGPLALVEPDVGFEDIVFPTG